MIFDKLTDKKKQLGAFRPMPDALVRNLDDWFRVELTYTSNAIEGNTLTRRETALVVEKGLTVGGKTLTEHLEATNHAHALDWVREQISRHPNDLCIKDILHLHNVILKGIDDHNAGHFRSVAVRISGSSTVLPNPRKVPDLMDGFIQWLQSTVGMHPVEIAAEAHYRLVTIHPFVDGNGRTARLLMNMILLMQGYPAAIIRKQERLAYIGALEKAQTGGTKDDYYTIINRAVNRSLDIYLKAVRGETHEHKNSQLMKLGTLAKAVGETNSTIRHWVKSGLIDIAEITPSGYQLFASDMVKRVEKINLLKAQRLTLKEIKDKL
jgi:cell filamentation protein, protein adenylyltransferase